MCKERCVLNSKWRVVYRVLKIIWVPVLIVRGKMCESKDVRDHIVEKIIDYLPVREREYVPTEIPFELQFQKRIRGAAFGRTLLSLHFLWMQFRPERFSFA
jgi:hypothetical protein